MKYLKMKLFFTPLRFQIHTPIPAIDFTGWQGNGCSMHAVIITGRAADKYYVYDPESGMPGEIFSSEYSVSTSTKYLL